MTTTALHAFKFPILVLLGALLASCSTRSEVRGEPSDAGIAATYTTDLERAKTAARDALSEVGLTVREDAAWDTRWRILASQGLTSGTLGRIARVLLETQGSSVLARVLVRSKMDTQDARMTDEALANDIQKKIASRLGASASRPASK